MVHSLVLLTGGHRSLVIQASDTAIAYPEYLQDLPIALYYQSSLLLVLVSMRISVTMLSLVMGIHIYVEFVVMQAMIIILLVLLVVILDLLGKVHRLLP